MGQLTKLIHMKTVKKSQPAYIVGKYPLPMAYLEQCSRLSNGVIFSNVVYKALLGSP